jgi:hypothetical protein
METSIFNLMNFRLMLQVFVNRNQKNKIKNNKRGHGGLLWKATTMEVHGCGVLAMEVHINHLGHGGQRATWLWRTTAKRVHGGLIQLSQWLKP